MSTLAHHMHFNCQECIDRLWLEAYTRGAAHVNDMIRKYSKPHAAIGLAPWGPGGREEKPHPFESGQTAAFRDAFGGARQ